MATALSHEVSILFARIDGGAIVRIWRCLLALILMLA
jgi:hypothetical protein